MEFETTMNKSKWDVIKEVSKGEKSASEIAKKTGQSIANVTQILKLLEAQTTIKKSKKSEEKRPGKPKIPYQLNQEIAMFGIIKKGLAERKIIRLKETNNFQKLFLQTQFTLTSDEQYAVFKYLFKADLLNKAELIALIETSEKEIQLFIITKHVQEIRENFSNMSVHAPSGKTKKIISWSHNTKEVEEGLERKEHYFLDLIKKAEVIIDTKNIFEKLREMV